MINWFKIFWMKLELVNSIKIWKHNQKQIEEYKDEGNLDSAKTLDEICTLRDAYLWQCRIENLKKGNKDIDYLKLRSQFNDSEFERKNQMKCSTCDIQLGLMEMMKHLREENPKLFKKYRDWDNWKISWLPVESINPKYATEVKIVQ